MKTPEPAEPKLAYHKPELRRYGGVHEQTRGAFAYDSGEGSYTQPEQMS